MCRDVKKNYYRLLKLFNYFIVYVRSKQHVHMSISDYFTNWNEMFWDKNRAWHIILTWFWLRTCKNEIILSARRDDHLSELTSFKQDVITMNEQNDSINSKIQQPVSRKIIFYPPIIRILNYKDNLIKFYFENFTLLPHKKFPVMHFLYWNIYTFITKLTLGMEKWKILYSLKLIFPKIAPNLQRNA